ncbi:MAG: peptide chain release factor N(5)-glutamine methyltransferase [Acidimicrobiaceae bacterium]|nr:peptide chain release factor N(5)-glutamine methyltransferase [Acidimicrobiaceae bacterium]
MTGVNSYLIAELIGEGLNRREARWLVEEFMTGADSDSIRSLRLAARRRLDGEPLQYVIGHWPFRGLDLDLDPRVLIPRPETEELVSVALGELRALGPEPSLVVDLGCGSGAIGLALLQESQRVGSSVALIAVDASREALNVAEMNAVKHGLGSVSFVQSSWFDALDESLRASFDLIVANPPYVGVEEFETLDEVLKYEPRRALVAQSSRGVEGLADLETIILQAPAWLAVGGSLVVEHGRDQRAAVLELAHEARLGQVSDLEDLSGHARILVARRC